VSDPVDTTKVGKYQAIQSALCELVSAESSLNMEPDPIFDSIPPGTPYNGYLSEKDGNAKHAIEHMHAAFRLMNMAHHDQEALKTQVYKLVVQLKELGGEPRIKTWLDVCSRCNSAEISTEAAFCASCTASLTTTEEP
jgi:hypothetical protein